jgi:hypothetical protein
MIENWAMFNIMYSVGLLIVKLEAAPKKTSVRVEGTGKGRRNTGRPSVWRTMFKDAAALVIVKEPTKS